MPLDDNERNVIISDATALAGVFIEIAVQASHGASEAQMILRSHFAKKEADKLFTKIFKEAQD